MCAPAGGCSISAIELLDVAPVSLLYRHDLWWHEGTGCEHRERIPGDGQSRFARRAFDENRPEEVVEVPEQIVRRDAVHWFVELDSAAHDIEVGPPSKSDEVVTSVSAETLTANESGPVAAPISIVIEPVKALLSVNSCAFVIAPALISTLG